MAALGIGALPVVFRSGATHLVGLLTPFGLLDARRKLLEGEHRVERVLTLHRVGPAHRPAVPSAEASGDGGPWGGAARYALGVERAITGYHLDGVGDRVAELSCGHDQHVRHGPPFQRGARTLDAGERAARPGAPLSCPSCDRAAPPDTLVWVRTTPVWDEHTLPAGLRGDHRVAEGTWGRIVVHRGRLRFTAATTPVIDVDLEVGSAQAVPPGIRHRVAPRGPVRFAIEFFAVGRGAETGAPVHGGGDPACWARLVCPDCGAVDDGGYHHLGCPAAGRP